MATYAQLIADVSDELSSGGGAVTIEHVKKAIARSIAHYERKPWWFTEIPATFPTVAGQEYYGLADNAIIPNIIQIQSLSIPGVGTLQPDHVEAIEGAQISPISGLPTRYSMLTGKIRLYPIPDSVYTVKLICNASLSVLTDDTDTNAWTTIAEELIRQASKARIASDIQIDDAAAARYIALEGRAYNELLAENRRRRPVKLLHSDVGMSARTFNIYAGV